MWSTAQQSEQKGGGGGGGGVETDERCPSMVDASKAGVDGIPTHGGVRCQLLPEGIYHSPSMCVVPDSGPV